MESNLIIVFYIDVRQIDPNDIYNFINGVAKRTQLNTETKDLLYIPIYGESRIECVNPIYITDSELIKKHERLMAELHEHLKNQLNNDKKDN